MRTGILRLRGGASGWFRLLGGVIALWGGSIREGWALGPHEIIVIENIRSPESREMARDYGRIWQVPDSNVISVEVPLAARDGVYDLSPEEFTARIWEPVNRTLHERRLDGHVLAWVYSVGFPVLVTTQPAMSLTGLTWVRNQPPDREKVAKGEWNSPVFAGPARPGAAFTGTRTLDALKDWVGVEMPLPAMMLGYEGRLGNTGEEIRRRWNPPGKSGPPEGAVCFVTNADVRSICRDWQFPGAVKELRSLGVSAEVTGTWPTNGEPLMGLMIGRVNVAPQTLNLRPGSIGDHLTSFGAAFEETGQTRISEWIRAGASAAAGTVTEPMSIAAKFPNGRVFAHLARGVTTLEAYALAVKCPLQLLIVGDPLSAPWAGRQAPLRISGITPGQRVQEAVRVRADPSQPDGAVFTKFLFLCDGAPLQDRGPKNHILLDPAKLAPGRHRLRGVAYGAGAVRRQAWNEVEFSCGGD